LRGQYDRGITPDKTPRLIKGDKPNLISNKKDQKNNETSSSSKNKNKKKSSIGPIGFSGNYQNVKVLQIINIHKADSLYRKFETNFTLATIVARLAGWKHGARLAQDQVWAKPPGAPPLVFHRDSPYFMFNPSHVVTVWIALDDMDPELGPLEYVKTSHKWGDGRVGSANQFFQSNSKNLLQSAAELEGVDLESLEIISMAGLQAGGLSIHDGKIWHGSDQNRSKTRPRRGLGLHFVPANVRFTNDASRSSLWRKYVTVEDPSQVDLPEEDFPFSNSQ
jgi:ectoine hydroxylase-related dioxygenase (phytanoyl-CoA dioxygenase family)